MRCEECVNWPPSAMGNKPCCFCYLDTPMNYFHMYYEVAYNKAKNEIYLDAYKKFENICFAV